MRYDDNETEFLLLSAEHVRWDRRSAGQQAKPADQAMPPAPEEIAVAGPHQATPAETPPPATVQAPPSEAATAEEPAPGSTEAPVEDKAAEAARLEV